jgi:hypothetical protein
LKAGTDSGAQWYPIPVGKWRKVLSTLSCGGAPLISDPKVVSNLAYSLQYLEYLQQCLVEIRLSEVLERQSIKSYVISAVSLIECLLSHLNRRRGGRGKELFEVLDSIKKKKLLGDKSKLYDELDKYRKLRNRVHMVEIRDDFGTDYQAFGRTEFNEIRKILHDLTSASALGLKSEEHSLFNFLKQRISEASGKK